MKLNIKKILAQHYLQTGEYITQAQLAREIVKLGLYASEHSAQNMLQRWCYGVILVVRDSPRLYTSYQ
jgi:hypothetical protein